MEILRLTGHETKDQIAVIEASEPEGGLDRFGRSRTLLAKYAQYARYSDDLEDFLHWYGLFIDYSGEVRNPTVTGRSGDDRVLLGGYGIAGEGGEVADIIKKVYFHDKANKDTMSQDRRDKLVLEFGDRFWYDFNVLRELGIGFRDVLQKNMDKLTHDPRTK